MTKCIAFLACQGTLPGSSRRRSDAYEHDRQFSAIKDGLAGSEAELTAIDWRAPIKQFAQFDAALVGTAWDYQDLTEEFLAKLAALENAGIALHNPSAIVRWNSDKQYLRELTQLGARTIPTLWVDRPMREDIERGFTELKCDKLVVKRQVGAGAEGQSLLTKGSPALEEWAMDLPAMIQPFLPAITEEGEYSFVFVEGIFSHALIKRAASDDYRIQSLYGGREDAIDPAPSDLSDAQRIVDLLPFPVPLYARIDMVRGDDGRLLLMEAEMIEPYLYPEQGQEFGKMVASALLSRLGK